MAYEGIVPSRQPASIPRERATPSMSPLSPAIYPSGIGFTPNAPTVFRSDSLLPAAITSERD